MSRRRLLPCLLAAAAAVFASGCAGGNTGGPRGEPLDVVKGSPDKTMAAGRAKVEINGPDVRATGVADLVAGGAALHVVEPRTGAVREEVTGSSPAPAGAPTFPAGIALTDVRGLVDLVRGTVKVYSYGGAEVQGADTIRYTIDDDELALALAATPPDRHGAIQQAQAAAGGRPTLKFDVWVDHLGRLRRIQIPTALDTPTPPTRVDGNPISYTIDFVDFGPDLELKPGS